jgi:hypothetical protein
MPRKTNAAVVTIGIDPGKNTLHLIGLDGRGGIVLLKRWRVIGLSPDLRMCRRASSV